MRRLLGLLGVALTVGACASASLVSDEQAEAIKRREQALALHTPAIQQTIKQSGRAGALAFLDLRDGRLVVLPGDTPGDAWASRPGRESRRERRPRAPTRPPGCRPAAPPGGRRADPRRRAPPHAPTA